jgi:aerobic carbon-monoxide dehydrogenase medium subunit
VKPPPFEYHAPESLDEALALKAELGDEASILAGGQSLLPLLNMRLARPTALIDLNRVSELAYVEERDGGIAVGAMTRQRALERSEVARRLCPLVGETLLHVAHSIVRNRGTVGGSIAHADPAAELPAALCALGGKLIARSRDRSREIAPQDFFLFHFSTALEPDEILSEVWFPALAQGAGHAFLEVSRRHGDFALCGAACIATNGAVRLGFSGVASRPVAVDSDDPEAIEAAIDPTDDVHATASYRRRLAQVLARRARMIARSRAGGQ